MSITHSDSEEVSANNPTSEYMSKTTYADLCRIQTWTMDCIRPSDSECKASALWRRGPSQIVHFTSNRAIYQNAAQPHQ